MIIRKKGTCAWCGDSLRDMSDERYQKVGNCCSRCSVRCAILAKSNKRTLDEILEPKRETVPADEDEEEF